MDNKIIADEKNYTTINFSTVSITSCEVYQEPTLLSLSGEYVVDRITKHSTGNSTNTNDLTFNPGDVYLNPDDISQWTV